MNSSATQARSAHTIVVCSVGSSAIFSQNFFSRFETAVLRVNRGEDLIKELQTLRPIGVLLLVSDPDQMQNSGWLRSLEQKILFEGMRVVLAVKHDVLNPAKLFSSKFLGQFHLVQCLGLRDLVLFDDSTTDADLDFMFERIRFAFGLSTENPFQKHFQLQSAHEEQLELAIPARISQVEDDQHLVIESAVYLQPGAKIKMRLMGLDDEPADLPLTVLENLPSGLRFNFGNSIRAAILKEHLHVMQRLISQELPSKILNKPLRRAMVITRSLALRQRLVTSLSLDHVESRIPLVRRNIKGDLPPLKPQFLVIEPAVLGASNAAEGQNEIDEYLALAGPQCLAILVGKRPDWNIPASERIFSIRDTSTLEDELSEVLQKTLPVSRPSGVENHIWFATDSVRSKVMLILRETSIAVSEAGIVFETPHVMRLWSNIEVRGLESRVHFVGRVAKVLRQEDSFRNVVKLGPRERPSFQVFVASIAANSTLEKTFRASVALYTKREAPYVPRSLPSQSLLNSAGTAASVAVSTRTVAQRPAQGTKSNKVEAGALHKKGLNPEDLTIGPDRAEEFGRSFNSKGSKDDGAQVLKKLFIVAVVLAGLLGLVWLGVKYGTAEKSVYGESFQKLFDGKGKGTSQSNP